jgi:hypothetical protein
MPPAIPLKLMEVSALSDIICRYCACRDQQASKHVLRKTSLCQFQPADARLQVSSQDAIYHVAGQS